MYKEIIQVSLQFSSFQSLITSIKLIIFAIRLALKKRPTDSTENLQTQNILFPCYQRFCFFVPKKNKGKMKSKEAGLGR